MKKTRFVGINFDHMHMGDLLRMVAQHPDAEIVGVCDENPNRMTEVVKSLGLAPSLVFTDHQQCLTTTQPDVAILCPATARHAEWTEKVAPYGVDIFMEKPFAASLAEADRMIAAVKKTGRRLVINWPLRWYPCHITAHRLVSEGRIGKLQEVHYYDGNRGPVRHGADKIEKSPTPAEKASSWFYQKAAGGGSLLDYLGYGVTLGTWFHANQKPLAVTTLVDRQEWLEVDEHSITLARYASGLSKFETRWGTFTDPWTHQPQPKCGFVLKGDAGTISSYDYESTIRVQDAAHPAGVDIPVDTILPPFQNPIHYLIHCIQTNTPVTGPLSPEVCRIGQEIVEAAIRSTEEERTIYL